MRMLAKIYLCAKFARTLLKVLFLISVSLIAQIHEKTCQYHDQETFIQERDQKEERILIFFVRISQAFKYFLHKQEKRVFVQFFHETVRMQRWVHASIRMHYECLNMEMNPVRHKFTERIFNQQKDKRNIIIEV